MKCPACNNHEYQQINLHSDQFHESLNECSLCGTTWSINHGLAEVVQDPNAQSFLSAISESGEADDYCGRDEKRQKTEKACP